MFGFLGTQEAPTDRSKHFSIVDKTGVQSVPANQFQVFHCRENWNNKIDI